jgi:hypothetical protein
MIPALVTIVVALGFAAASAHIARAKGLNVVYCTLLGLLLPIAGLLIVMAEPPSRCAACGFIASGK